MECKEENSPNDVKPKLETTESEPPPPPPQQTPPTVIRRLLQINDAGDIVVNTEEAPEASTEEVVKTSASTPQQQSPIEQKVDLQDAGQYQEMIQQNAQGQFVEKQSVYIANFAPQGDFSEQEFVERKMESNVSVFFRFFYLLSAQLSNDMEQHSAEYANLQTAPQYHNGYSDPVQYLMTTNPYQHIYIDRTSAENSPPNTLIYRDDPNLATSSRYQVRYNNLYKTELYQILMIPYIFLL